ncbi:MAG: ABC transporter, partial [Roseovarius sp.]|nr:ABC transporter [Roseovarius sp.]
MVRRADAGAKTEDRQKARKVGALTELWHFVRPYRLLALAAVLALVLTAAVSLVLPMAVRHRQDERD